MTSPPQKNIIWLHLTVLHPRTRRDRSFVQGDMWNYIYFQKVLEWSFLQGRPGAGIHRIIYFSYYFIDYVFIILFNIAKILKVDTMIYIFFLVFLKLIDFSNFFNFKWVKKLQLLQHWSWSVLYRGHHVSVLCIH